jgi:hypothetical protein
MLDMSDGILPYIICQDIENRANLECKEINISEVLEENKVVIRVDSDAQIDETQKVELEKVSKLCENVQFISNSNATELVIAKLQ